MATLRTTPDAIARSRGGRSGTRNTANARSGTKPAVAAKARALAVPVVQDRVFPVFLLLALLHLALAIRIAYLQIWRRDDLTRQAEQLREKSLALPARRGVLLDRSGNLLVQNEPAYNVEIDPNLWFANPNPGDTAEMRQQRAVDALTRILGDVNVAAILKEHPISRGKSGRYRTILIAKEIPIGVGERIKKEKLLGVGVKTTAHRVAVLGDLAPHIIGFTGAGGQGLDGLEHSLEHGLTYSLTGSSGQLSAEFDTRGRVIPGTIRNHRPAQHGTNFILTIDSALQHTVQESLEHAFKLSKAEAATAIVLEPKTGDILALANYPAYDVNHWQGVPAEARMNRAVSAPYEPGSTLKTFTIAGALEDHKITPENTYYCNSYRKVGKRTIHCHNNEKHGSEDVTGVLAHSCNVATAEIAFSLGRTRLYHYLQAFGFGAKTKSGLPGEEPGKLASPETWPDIQLANVAFGQGISVTPLQLAAAYGAIANNGIYMRPRIVRGIQDDLGQVMLLHQDEGRRVVSESTAQTMQKMLYTTIEQGTGKPARLDGYTAGGKTATAQLVERGKRGYGGRYVSSFVGITPAKNSQFVILVTVTKPQGAYYGGTVAGPVFKEIAEKALLARRVPRDGVMRGKLAPPPAVPED